MVSSSLIIEYFVTWLPVNPVKMFQCLKCSPTLIHKSYDYVAYLAKPQTWLYSYLLGHFCDYLPIQLYFYLPSHLNPYLSTSLNIYSWSYLLIYLCVYLSTYLCAYLSTYLCSYLPTYICSYLSTYPCSYLFIQMPAANSFWSYHCIVSILLLNMFVYLF